MKIWRIASEIKGENREERMKEIVRVLLRNRGIRSEEEAKMFLQPAFSLAQLQTFISKEQISLAVKRIKEAVERKEQIVIFGDYDCDGVCGTAILWRSLNRLGAKVQPFVPNRRDGYGLSSKGIEKILSFRPSLVITVDNGITAIEQVSFLSSKGVDVIITDHHLPSDKLPEALAIIHSLALSGSAVVWVLAQSCLADCQLPPTDCQLDLVALATITDLVPLTGPSRALVKTGLYWLNRTENPGLKALIKKAGLTLGKIGVYEAGWILGPRLNATGRLTSAMDSLRLLCFSNPAWIRKLVEELERVNQERQRLLQQMLLQAKDTLKEAYGTNLPLCIFLSDPSYHEGVVGLVAARLAEEFSRPVIIGSERGEIIKASGRSIPSFNLVEAVAQARDLLEDFGGHPLAVGLVFKKQNLPAVKRRILAFVQNKLSEETLQPTLDIDCQIRLDDLTWQLFDELSKFEPFGIGNPRPLFLTKNLKIVAVRRVGNSQQHLKLKLDDLTTGVEENKEVEVSSTSTLDGIGFNLGFMADQLKEGDVVDLVYNLDKDVWNGEEILQLKVRDLRQSVGF